MKKFQIEKFYFRVYLTNVIMLLGTVIAGIGFFYSNDMSIAMFGITMITTTVGIWMPSVKQKKSSNVNNQIDIPINNEELSKDLTKLINNGNIADLLVMLNKINDNTQIDKMELGEPMKPTMENIGELEISDKTENNIG